MCDVLHVDASVRALSNDNPDHDSISKKLARRFISELKKHTHIDEYMYRDIGVNPPPFITQDWIGAVFTPKASRTARQHQILAQSDMYIAELAKADVVVISSPMYNYGMPAQLKAWFDQIIRINETFDFDLARGDKPLAPLMSGKTLVIITSSGEFGFEKGGINEAHSHLVPHLRTLSKYLGVDQIFEVASEYQEFADERHTKSMNMAEQELSVIASVLAEKKSVKLK
ncbi:FMN-dependent NADH-azoreductase [Pseudoalteromonas phenolica]|uniref:FMN dependent NADH:quinone oxidoreductase n=2 Tax=Pseudoalteromonas phenolica TaxID=161398 RepID=A0A0S2K6H9_9GAMM|nr:NAD(P)H-dependent oxidoreductase [Pseudoalteromonas phenolica]ALO44032.1 FMN-dependent NADH-azoreductase [Pseudoalteromonas phenolica]MBE0357009.1 FMN-dependent NADH-azoreductase [Pseudoalteromonas phenolica O-BC30]